MLYACRDQGDLVMACGSDDHRQSADDWRVVHRGHVLDLDASLGAIADLGDDGQAERTAADGPWVRGPLVE